MDCSVENVKGSTALRGSVSTLTSVHDCCDVVYVRLLRDSRLLRGSTTLRGSNFFRGSTALRGSNFLRGSTAM